MLTLDGPRDALLPLSLITCKHLRGKIPGRVTSSAVRVLLEVCLQKKAFYLNFRSRHSSRIIEAAQKYSHVHRGGDLQTTSATPTSVR